MKSNIKFIVKKIICFLLHLLWIIPVNQRKIFFSSFYGRQYSCNPKYLYEYLVETKLASKYKFVWELYCNDDECLPTPSTVVVTGKVDSILHCMTSKFIVTNVEFPWYIPLRKEQVLLQTWHGGGAYKKVGLAVQWGEVEDKEQRLNSRQVTYYISSCARFSEIQSVSKAVDIQRFLKTGMPRNAIFFRNQEHLKSKVYSSLGITDSCRKLVLYAPTYRGNPSFKKGESLLECLDILSLVASLKKRFGGEWVCAYRSHYYNAGIQDKEHGIAIDATSYGDMQELLYVADALITDYSSSIWDFALTRKPMFLFATDYDTYKRERDFYTPVEQWPAALATSNEELWRSILDFDYEKHAIRCKAHLESLGSYENASTCKQVWDIIGE